MEELIHFVISVVLSADKMDHGCWAQQTSAGRALLGHLTLSRKGAAKANIDLFLFFFTTEGRYP